MDYAALKAELQNDPTARGYAAHLTAGTFSPVADLLNEVQGGITIDRPFVPGWEFLAALVWADLTGLAAGARDYLLALAGMESVPTDQPNVRAALLAILPGGSDTLANLAALQVRNGSRAEQLFGAGVVVSASDAVTAWRDF